MSTPTSEHQYWEDRSATFDRDSVYIVGADLNGDIKTWLQGQFAGTDAVLELGCGTGAFSEAVAPLVKDLVVTDMSELMLNEARVKLAEQGNVRVSARRRLCDLLRRIDVRRRADGQPAPRRSRARSDSSRMQQAGQEWRQGCRSRRHIAGNPAAGRHPVGAALPENVGASAGIEPESEARRARAHDASSEVPSDG